MRDEPPESSQERRALSQRLEAIVSSLGAAEASARVRDLLARASDYSKALQSWELNPPSPAHRDALRDLIVELEVKARGARRVVTSSTALSPVTPAAPVGSDTLNKHTRDVK